MGNPFLERVARRGKIGHGKSSEKRVLKALGAHPTPASGAVSGAKGDGNLRAKKHFKIEVKSTVHATLSLDLGWLVKIAYEALSNGQVPALAVSFVTPESKERQHGGWVMIPRAEFQELVESEE